MPTLNPSSHNDRISITVNLAALQSGVASFGVLLLGKNLDLEGTDARSTTYASLAEVDAAFDAGDVSAWVLAAATEVFGQTPAVPSITVGNQDTVAVETVEAALNLVLAETTDFYYVCLESRADADILSGRTWVNTKAAAGSKYLVVAQSDDASWLDSGVPAGLSAIAATERLAIVYHSVDAECRAEQLVGKVAGFDPDERSAPFNVAADNIGTFTALALTQTQKGFIRSNYANVALPMGSYDPYFDPGVNCNNRSLYEIVTADWLEVRIREALADLYAAKSYAGLKVPVNRTGQQEIAAAIQAVLDRGIAAGHIEPGYAVTPQTITPADTTARRLRFVIGAQNVVGAIQASVTVNLSTSPVSA